MAITRARPGVVLAVCAIAAAVIVPIALWRWMEVHNSFLGASVGTVQLDAKWAYVLLGVSVAVSYGALAGIALVLTRKAERSVRNAVTLAILPISLALAWLSFGWHR